MNIGYIGLGALGGELAKRFLGAHDLHVWDLNASAVDAFAKLGATPAPDAAELARRCDVVLTCLPRSRDVRQAIFGPRGLAEGLAPGKLVIDQTSGIPGQTRAMADELMQRGVAMMDAAVSANPPVVKKGEATLMVAGPDETVARAEPVLRTITDKIFRCGTVVGLGQAMKIVNNDMNAGCRLGTLELVAMGRKAGLSLECMSAILNDGGARNLTTVNMLPAIIEGRPATDFALSLMLKDLDQAVGLGMEGGAPMPITSVVRGLLQVGVNTLGPQARLDDVVGLIESMAGTRLRSEAGSAGPMRIKAAGDGAGLKVGYVGLGDMGGAVARRLLVSRPLVVHDARADVVQALAREGATPAAGLRELARECDVILLCLPTSAVVQDVLFGPGGLSEGLAPGKIVVDQTSGEPEATRALADRLAPTGATLVDAPVSGGPAGAKSGTIAIMCGGDPGQIARVLPVLEAISPNVTYCGALGTGHTAKAVNNAISSLCRMHALECVAAGLKVGLAMQTMAEVLDGSSGWSVASRKLLPALVAGRSTTNFQMHLMLKDLRIAAGIALQVGAPILISGAVRSLYEAGINRFGPLASTDKMVALFEDLAGVRYNATAPRQ